MWVKEFFWIVEFLLKRGKPLLLLYKAVNYMSRTPSVLPPPYKRKRKREKEREKKKKDKGINRSCEGVPLVGFYHPLSWILYEHVHKELLWVWYKRVVEVSNFGNLITLFAEFPFTAILFFVEYIPSCVLLWSTLLYLLQPIPCQRKHYRRMFNLLLLLYSLD